MCVTNLGVHTCAVSPLGKDRRYADLDAGLLPKTESLADTVERFLPYWHDTIAPAIKSGKRVGFISKERTQDEIFENGFSCDLSK